ncbi:hypothetical protein L345_05158, partial [Ophiophagus hannah]
MPEKGISQGGAAWGASSWLTDRDASSLRQRPKRALCQSTHHRLTGSEVSRAAQSDFRRGEVSGVCKLWSVNEQAALQDLAACRAFGVWCKSTCEITPKLGAGVLFVSVADVKAGAQLPSQDRPSSVSFSRLGDSQLLTSHETWPLPLPPGMLSDGCSQPGQQRGAQNDLSESQEGILNYDTFLLSGDGATLYVGGRDAILALDIGSAPIRLKGKIPWSPSPEKRRECVFKKKSNETSEASLGTEPESSSSNMNLSWRDGPQPSLPGSLKGSQPPFGQAEYAAPPPVLGPTGSHGASPWFGEGLGGVFVEECLSPPARPKDPLGLQGSHVRYGNEPIKARDKTSLLLPST